MTLHITYNHKCPQCEALYIPYDDVPCPRCGLVEAERTDYIQQAAMSLRFNKSKGSYVPAAWWAGSFGDQILYQLFILFDAYEKMSPPDFHAFAASHFEKMNWGDHLYLKDHILGIADRLHKLLSSGKNQGDDYRLQVH